MQHLLPFSKIYLVYNLEIIDQHRRLKRYIRIFVLECWYFVTVQGVFPSPKSVSILWPRTGESDRSRHSGTQISPLTTRQAHHVAINDQAWIFYELNISIIGAILVISSSQLFSDCVYPPKAPASGRPSPAVQCMSRPTRSWPRVNLPMSSNLSH
jgi:hypothetical protein